MTRPVILACVLAALASSTLLALTPTSAAAPTCGFNGVLQPSWTRGEEARTEVVGSGSTSVGVYARERTGCHSSNGHHTWDEVCPAGTLTVVAPGVTVPDVRVLGMTVVDRTTLPPTTLVPPTPIPFSPSELYVYCTHRFDYGVYANRDSVGTDQVAGIPVPG